MAIDVDALIVPTTPSDQLALLELVEEHIGSASAMILRRILFELKRVKEDPRLKLPIVRRP
jgi:hypothetical protein